MRRMQKRNQQRPKAPKRQRIMPIQKPIRDADNPLKILSICYGGMRSGLVLDAIKDTLEEMNYSRFFKLKNSEEARLTQEDVNNADIVLLMGRPDSIGTPPKAAPLLSGQKHKIVYWNGNWRFTYGETQEDLITRILYKASKFLDLKF